MKMGKQSDSHEGEREELETKEGEADEDKERVGAQHVDEDLSKAADEDAGAEELEDLERNDVGELDAGEQHHQEEADVLEHVGVTAHQPLVERPVLSAISGLPPRGGPTIGHASKHAPQPDAQDQHVVEKREAQKHAERRRRVSRLLGLLGHLGTDLDQQLVVHLTCCQKKSRDLHLVLLKSTPTRFSPQPVCLFS